MTNPENKQNEPHGSIEVIGRVAAASGLPEPSMNSGTSPESYTHRLVTEPAAELINKRTGKVTATGYEALRALESPYDASVRTINNTKYT